MKSQKENRGRRFRSESEYIMKIQKQEVKTFYEIEFDAADFANAVEKYEKYDHVRYAYQDAFEKIDISDKSEEGYEAAMKVMSVYGCKDTYNFIADYFGFDGWHNAGYYNEKRKVYRMEVFNYGDSING